VAITCQFKHKKKNHCGENSHILIKHILNKNIALFFLALDDMSNY